MKKFTNLFLFLIVTIPCLFVAELVVKTIAQKIHTDERNLAYRYDAELGWFPKENSEMKYQGVISINVKHNSLGFRGPEFQNNKKPNILFLGDSFTWGYDVEEKNRLTERLSKKIGNQYNILNLGVSGYGTDQEFLLLQKYYDQFKPKIVFVILCENDFDNNSSNVVYHGYYKPYFTYENNKLTLKGSPARISTNYKMIDFDKNHPVLSKSHLVKWAAKLYGRAEYHIRKKNLPDPTYYIFEEMNNYLSERGSKLVVGIITKDPKTEEIFASKKISYIDLNNKYRYSEHGKHWTPEGHQFAADRIYEFLNKNK
jgi:hypothetical protein